MSVAAMWFILGIILLAVELVSPVFVLFFFGLGAWAAGVTALFVDDLAIEVVVFGPLCFSFRCVGCLSAAFEERRRFHRMPRRWGCRICMPGKWGR